MANTQMHNEDVQHHSSNSAQSLPEPCPTPLCCPPEPAHTTLSTSAKALFALDTTDDDGISPYLLERRKFYKETGWQKLRSTLRRTSTLCQSSPRD